MREAILPNTALALSALASADPLSLYPPVVRNRSSPTRTTRMSPNAEVSEIIAICDGHHGVIIGRVDSGHGMSGVWHCVAPIQK